jgi:hypothetical protein
MLQIQFWKLTTFVFYAKSTVLKKFKVVTEIFLIPFIWKLYRYIQQMVENYERREEECSVAHLHINRFKASCVSREQDLRATS